MAVVQRKDILTAYKVQPEYYSDFLDDFDIHPVKKDLVRYTNENAVKRSIKNLLMTNRGERLFQNDIGSDIRGLLFEHATPATEQMLADLIKNTIADYEPRATVESVDVSTSVDQHYMTATIIFTIINKQEPVTLEVVLDRIR